MKKARLARLASTALALGVLSPIVPAAAEPLGEVSQIAAGYGHSCALMTDGTVRCWGLNDHGQLGIGTQQNQLNPVTVKREDGIGTLSNVSQIAAAEYHTCAVLYTGTALCWGFNDQGQLGDGTTNRSFLPTPVPNEAGTASLSNLADITTGVNHTCARLRDGTARCWGANHVGQLGGTTTGYPPRAGAVLNADATANLHDIAQIEAGAYYTCARLTDGTVRCWGWGPRLGNNDTTNRGLPVLVRESNGTTPLANVRQISAGSTHTCAVLFNGTVRCWGSNYYGNLGDSTFSDRLTATVVLNATASGPLDNVARIDVARGVSCVVLTSAPALCWGNNFHGQLGDGLRNTHSLPLPMNPDGSAQIPPMIEVVPAGYHSCARFINNVVGCWGRNNDGQLGNGTRYESHRPVMVQE